MRLIKPRQQSSEIYLTDFKADQAHACCAVTGRPSVLRFARSFGLAFGPTRAALPLLGADIVRPRRPSVGNPQGLAQRMLRTAKIKGAGGCPNQRAGGARVRLRRRDSLTRVAFKKPDTADFFMCSHIPEPFVFAWTVVLF